MKRRDFLRTLAIASGGLIFNDGVTAEDLIDSGWRTFEVSTRVEILKPSGVTRIWLPTALCVQTLFQKTLSTKFIAEHGSARLFTTEADALGIFAAEFPAGLPAVGTLISRVATRSCAADFVASGKASKASRAELEHFLRPTKLLPTDGIVKSTAMRITTGARGDLDKARALYEWIVDNTFRDPKTRGCGVGDIRFMLESGDLGGKCADLNALYVGLARSVGLPARDVYGIRVAKSQLGYKSLGVASENITKAQHCRAQVYLQDFGWIPVDPADVRKVVLEEPPGNRPLNNEVVKRARVRLFGSWEMNWMAYNYGHDVPLPGAKGDPVGYFMYPQAETADGRLDCLDPENFKYEITSKETTSSHT